MGLGPVPAGARRQDSAVMDGTQPLSEDERLDRLFQGWRGPLPQWYRQALGARERSSGAGSSSDLAPSQQSTEEPQTPLIDLEEDPLDLTLT